MSILQKICAQKADHVAGRKKALPLSALQDALLHAEAPRGFIKALRAKQDIPVIAEIKKASPSRGVIREDFSPALLAKSYEDAGAACLSVLTDIPYFHGRDEDLKSVKAAVSLPVLRKDFIVDSYQIYESRALGADCVLLIMAALHVEQAREFYGLALTLQMDVLVEVHDEAELAQALLFQPQMIGVNNRNLKTMKTSLETSHLLSPLIPDPVLKISESGIGTRDEIFALQKAGFHGFLIGETFMNAADNGDALRAILNGT